MSGSDTDKLAERYVTGRNIHWLGVASTLVSSFILATWAGFIGFWEAVWAQPRRLVGGVFDYWTTLASRPFEHGADQFWVAWKAAATSLPELGPFTFAFTVALMAVVFWLAFDVGWGLVKGVFA